MNFYNNNKKIHKRNFKQSINYLYDKCYSDYLNNNISIKIKVKKNNYNDNFNFPEFKNNNKSNFYNKIKNNNYNNNYNNNLKNQTFNSNDKMVLDDENPKKNFQETLNNILISNAIKSEFLMNKIFKNKNAKNYIYKPDENKMQIDI